MKQINFNQMQNLQGGLCIIGEPGSEGCLNRCNGGFIAWEMSGGHYGGPLCLA